MKLKKLLLGIGVSASLFIAGTADAHVLDDAVEWNGHYYKIFANTCRTWEQAKKYCESLGGHLAILDTPEENRRVYHIMKELGYSLAYFGLTDLGHNGHWKWVNGKPLTWSNWSPGEPNSNAEHYAMFYFRSEPYKWNDGTFGPDPADTTFICEWDSDTRRASPRKPKSTTSKPMPPNIVKVSGMGKDRNSAIRDAARNAVQQVVGVYIDSRTLVHNSVVALDEIYAKSQGYVKNVSVLNEGWQNGSYQVNAQIDVNTDANSSLMNQLHMIMMLNDPRISVIVLKENNTTSENAHDTISEGAMSERLVDLGFSHVVDAHIVSNLQDAKLLYNIYNGKTSLSGVGASYGVDFLVLGQSNIDVSKVSLNTNNPQSVGNADLSVKIIKFDTGDIIGTFTTEGKGVDISHKTAERKALKTAANAAAQKLEDKFKKISANPMQGVQITILTSDYNKVEQIANALRNLNGVQNVNIREHRNGKALLEIETSQSPNSIVSMLKPATNLQFTVKEISNSSVQLTIN